MASSVMPRTLVTRTAAASSAYIRIDHGGEYKPGVGGHAIIGIEAHAGHEGDGAAGER